MSNADAFNSSGQLTFLFQELKKWTAASFGSAKLAVFMGTGGWTGYATPFCLAYRQGRQGHLIADRLVEAFPADAVARVCTREALESALTRLKKTRLIIFEEMCLTDRLVKLQHNLCMGTVEHALGGSPTAEITEEGSAVEPCHRAVAVINVLPVSEIERSALADRFLISQVADGPAGEGPAADWLAFHDKGRAQIADWDRACLLFRQQLKRESPREVSLPVVKSKVIFPGTSRGDWSTRWRQLACITINAAWHGQGSNAAPGDGKVVGTIEDLRQALRLCVEAGVDDHWGEVDQRLLRFFELLLGLPWDDKGKLLQEIQSDLQERFHDKASDPAYVPSPIHGRNTGEWEPRTILRRMHAIEKLIGGFRHKDTREGYRWYKADGLDDAAYESFFNLQLEQVDDTATTPK